MRPWFYLDKLSPQERATIKRWHLRIAGAYSVVALLLVALVVAKTDLVQSQLAKLAASGNAVAAESSKHDCADRDIKLVTAIEDAGEARTMPNEKLGEAFAMLLEARGLCSTGRVAEALAVYDSIVIAPVQSAAK
jgi:hypothetical protein